MNEHMTRLALSALPLLLLAPSAARALEPADAVAAHQQLATTTFGPETPVPAAGTAFTRDVASWRLEAGTLRLQKPLADGAVTGAVFTGRGSFRIEVPDRVERAQLTRFTGKPEQASFEIAFDRLLLRAPGGVDRLLGVEAALPWTPEPLALERRNRWRDQQLRDADARVVAGLLIPGDEYLWVDMHTAEHGWVSFEVEPWRQEELAVDRFERGFPERWLSLDRAEDRGADGAPSMRRRDAVRIDDVEIKADLRAAGRAPRAGSTEQHPRLGRFTVTLTMTPQLDGARALRLALDPEAQVSAVRDAAGATLAFLRQGTHEQTSWLGDPLQDDDLLVVLPAPLRAGTPVRVTVDYTLQVLTFVGGRSWYPDEADSYLEDPHTGTIDILVPARVEARAMGALVSNEKEGDARRLRYRVERPTMMLTFVLAEHALEEEVKLAGAPTVRVFGPDPGSTGRAKLHNVGADVVNSTAYFQQLFGMPLRGDQLTVTSITASHGQAFEGFLHLAEGTFDTAHPGASELFHAHEVAHQWWGHRVPWASYRDQWLSEAFAEYSAMMFVEAAVENGPRHLQEVLDAYRQMLLGSLRGAMGKFARPGLLPLNDAQRARVGPIAIGWRAGTSDAPGGYFAQAYHRGAWTLHMLRTLLRQRTKSDETFLRVLRTFLAEHDGKPATTADFVAAVERAAPGEWDWFFEQWVYGTAIPTYRWRHEILDKPEGKVLVLQVRQEGVPSGFKMPVPVVLELGGDKQGTLMVLVDQPEERFEIPLPAAPKKVTFAPGHMMLARVERW